MHKTCKKRRIIWYANHTETEDLKRITHTETNMIPYWGEPMSRMDKWVGTVDLGKWSTLVGLRCEPIYHLLLARGGSGNKNWYSTHYIQYVFQWRLIIHQHCICSGTGGASVREHESAAVNWCHIVRKKCNLFGGRCPIKLSLSLGESQGLMTNIFYIWQLNYPAVWIQSPTQFEKV